MEIPPTPEFEYRTRRRAARRRMVMRRRRSLFLLVLVLLGVLGGRAVLGGDEEPAEPSLQPGPIAGGAPSPQASPGEDPADIPIKHVVFIVKENRTFDNYFARYPGAEGATTGET